MSILPHLPTAISLKTYSLTWLYASLNRTYFWRIIRKEKTMVPIVLVLTTIYSLLLLYYKWNAESPPQFIGTFSWYTSIKYQKCAFENTSASIIFIFHLSTAYSKNGVVNYYLLTCAAKTSKKNVFFQVA